MVTDQRKYCPHLVALEILNKVLNDASGDNSNERRGSTSSGEEEAGDVFQNSAMNE